MQSRSPQWQQFRVKEALHDMPQGARRITPHPQDTPATEEVKKKSRGRPRREQKTSREGKARKRGKGGRTKTETSSTPEAEETAHNTHGEEGRQPTTPPTQKHRRDEAQHAKRQDERRQQDDQAEQKPTQTRRTEPARPQGPRQAHTHGQQPCTRWESAPPGPSVVGGPRRDGGGGPAVQAGGTVAGRVAKVRASSRSQEGIHLRRGCA